MYNSLMSLLYTAFHFVIVLTFLSLFHITSTKSRQSMTLVSLLCKFYTYFNIAAIVSVTVNAQNTVERNNQNPLCRQPTAAGYFPKVGWAVRRTAKAGIKVPSGTMKPLFPLSVRPVSLLQLYHFLITLVSQNLQALLMMIQL